MKVLLTTLLLVISLSFGYGSLINAGTDNMYLLLNMPADELQKVVSIGDKVTVHYGFEIKQDSSAFTVGCKTKRGIGVSCGQIIEYQDLLIIKVPQSIWERGMEQTLAVLSLPLLTIGTLLGIVSWA